MRFRRFAKDFNKKQTNRSVFYYTECPSLAPTGGASCAAKLHTSLASFACASLERLSVRFMRSKLGQSLSIIKKT